MRRWVGVRRSLQGRASPVTRELLASDKDRVAALLKFHVVPGAMASANVRNGNAPDASRRNHRPAQSGTFVTVEDVVDRVLTPPTQ